MQRGTEKLFPSANCMIQLMSPEAPFSIFTVTGYERMEKGSALWIDAIFGSERMKKPVLALFMLNLLSSRKED